MKKQTNKPSILIPTIAFILSIVSVSLCFAKEIKEGYDLSGQIYPINQVELEKDAYFKTIEKIKSLESDNKVYYDKVQPLKEQYCFIKVQIKEINGEVIKQEIVECADGRKAYDGPSYWELFAQFYYRDMNTPAYCRRYERPSHAYNIPGKVCLDKNGKWEARN